MKKSIHCHIKDFAYNIFVIGFLISMPLLLAYLLFKPKVNNLTGFMAIAGIAIVAIILGRFFIRYYIKQIFEYIIRKPQRIEKAIVGSCAKMSVHKYLRFRDVTRITLSGQKGVYVYRGEFDFQVYDYFCRISILPYTHLICGIEQTSEVIPEKRKIRRIDS